MGGLKHQLKTWASAAAGRAGYRLVREGEPVVPQGMRLIGEREGVAGPGTRLVPDHVAVNGHKLIDVREEPVFGALAAEVGAEGRTLLAHDRLYVLWQAVNNVRHLQGDVAEVGTYRGGSARFLACALERLGLSPPLHVFDTFEGHPSVIVPALDGEHTTGMFADTSFDEVRNYLSPHANVVFHRGPFQETCVDVASRRFALAHIDVDIYESTVACLEFFWPRLLEGGVLVLDDYGFTTCRGLKTAVDAFVAATQCPAWYMHTGQAVLSKSAA